MEETKSGRGILMDPTKARALYLVLDTNFKDKSAPILS